MFCWNRMFFFLEVSSCQLENEFVQCILPSYNFWFLDNHMFLGWGKWYYSFNTSSRVASDPQMTQVSTHFRERECVAVDDLGCLRVGLVPELSTFMYSVLVSVIQVSDEGTKSFLVSNFCGWFLFVVENECQFSGLSAYLAKGLTLRILIINM